MLRLPHMSLANKCQLTIIIAVALMLAASTLIVAQRLADLADDSPKQRAQDLAQLLLTGQVQLADRLEQGDLARRINPPDGAVSLALVGADDFPAVAAMDNFLAGAIERFELRGDTESAFDEAEDADQTDYFRYIRAIRQSDLRALGISGPENFSPGVDVPPAANPLEGVLLIQLRDEATPRRVALNTIYLAAAALAAALIGALAFWLIVSRIVLTPIRLLSGYASRVNDGESNLRAEIHTGDEYQKLAEMFNDMLDRSRKSDDELRTLNKGLDLKLGELAESNVALYEANKVKGEFLANVSHELRTPLNSIAGFAEVLRDTLDSQDAVDEKRRRYAQNILTSSKQLLELINDLLDLAKIEAGRLELRVGSVSLADTCEGLATLIRPMAESRQVRLRLKVEPNLPMVETDAGRLQRIIFNFLSNAVKFTPAQGTVTLLASQVPGAEGQEPTIRIAISDTGPGIAPDDHQRIFEKFTQLDASATRAQGGTGLGLTICRDLADLLQGTIEVESDEGKGATFSLTIPRSIKPRTVPLMPEGE